MEKPELEKLSISISPKSATSPDERRNLRALKIKQSIKNFNCYSENIIRFLNNEKSKATIVN